MDGIADRNEFFYVCIIISVFVGEVKRPFYFFRGNYSADMMSNFWEHQVDIFLKEQVFQFISKDT